MAISKHLAKFNPKPLIVYHLVLDNSKSMQIYHPDLKNLLSKHLKSLQNTLPNQQVNVTSSLFNSEIQSLGMSYTETINMLKKIENNGNTNLFDAIIDNLEWLAHTLAKENESNIKKIYFVLITDGHENKSSALTAHTVNEFLASFKNKYAAEFIMISGSFHDLACDIRLTIPSMSQYAADTPALAIALTNLQKYICGKMN
jgi:hypothetical protein